MGFEDISENHRSQVSINTCDLRTDPYGKTLKIKDVSVFLFRLENFELPKYSLNEHAHMLQQNVTLKTM